MQECPEGYVIVGQISGLFGVKGWLKVFSHTDPRENIIRYSPWTVHTAEGWREIEVEQGQRQGKGVVAQLANITDRDMASPLIGCDIALRKEQLPQLAQDEFYWNDLVGLKVINQDDVELGVVDHLIETGSNDVLVLKGDSERLIPYIQDQVILDIDLEAGEIRVDWDPDF